MFTLMLFLNSLFKKPPMKFKVWESKLCDRMNIWYKAAEKDGQELVSINIIRVTFYRSEDGTFG